MTIVLFVIVIYAITILISRNLIRRAYTVRELERFLDVDDIAICFVPILNLCISISLFIDALSVTDCGKNITQRFFGIKDKEEE